MINITKELVKQSETYQKVLRETKMLNCGIFELENLLLGINI